MTAVRAGLAPPRRAPSPASWLITANLPHCHSPVKRHNLAPCHCWCFMPQWARENDYLLRDGEITSIGVDNAMQWRRHGNGGRRTPRRL